MGAFFIARLWPTLICGPNLDPRPEPDPGPNDFLKCEPFGSLGPLREMFFDLFWALGSVFRTPGTEGSLWGPGLPVKKNGRGRFKGK